MNHYEYEAEDAAGLARQGQISAATANEAVKTLSALGLRIRRLKVAAAVPPPAQAAPPSPSSTRRPRQAAIQQEAPSVQAGLGQASQSRQAAPQSVIRTRPTRHKDMYLFMAQLAELLETGISPVEAFEALSQRGLHRDLGKACAEIAPRLTEGRRISDQLARYPDLFPPFIVGSVRAGEESGNLPMVCRVCSEQQQRTYRINIGYWWAWVAVWNTALLFAFMYPTRGIVDKSIDYINGKSQGVNVFQAYWFGMMNPVSLLFIAFVFFLWAWGWARHQTFTRKLRHRLAMAAPFIKKRTMAENLMFLSWHLSHLAKSGRSPWQAFQLAADALPNIAYSEKVKAATSGLTDTSKFSSIVAQLEAVPPEWRGFIQTGEMTGRLPQALEQASAMAREESKHHETNAMWRIGCWAVIVVVGGGIIGFMMFYGYYLTQSFRVLE